MPRLKPRTHSESAVKSIDIDGVKSTRINIAWKILFVYLFIYFFLARKKSEIKIYSRAFLKFANVRPSVKRRNILT